MWMWLTPSFPWVIIKQESVALWWGRGGSPQYGRVWGLVEDLFARGRTAFQVSEGLAFSGCPISPLLNIRVFLWKQFQYLYSFHLPSLEKTSLLKELWNRQQHAPVPTPGVLLLWTVVYQGPPPTSSSSACITCFPKEAEVQVWKRQISRWLRIVGRHETLWLMLIYLLC